MQYDLFVQELKKLPCDDFRSDDPENLELVVKVIHLPQIYTLLETFFGPAVKPAGKSPSAENRRVSDPYGGIRQDQTLYYLESEELYYYSLIWPWGNGQSVTVKVIRAR